MPTVTKYRINTGSHIDELGVRHLKNSDAAVFESIQNLLKHNLPGEQRFEKIGEREIDRDGEEFKLRMRGATGEDLEGEEIPEELTHPADNTSDEDENQEIDLFSMTVKELKQYADDNEIDLEDATTKADIISAIQLAEEE
jgi:hypothetical protein